MSQVNSGEFNTKVVLTLNETVKNSAGENEYKKIKDVDLPMPILADFGIEAEQSKNEKGELEFEDGIPVYVDAHYDWLMSAIAARVAAQARNKFTKGELKDNAKLATNFAELTAVGERNGEALKARHDCKKAFVAYLEALNKKKGVVDILSGLFGDANAIMTCKPDYLQALAHHVPVFAGKLTESDKVRYANTLNKIAEAIDAATSGASLEDMM